MFLTVLGRVYGIDPEEHNEVSFADVTPGSWYAPFVEWAAQAGITTGDGQGSFRPFDPITREQLCVMLARFAEYAGLPLEIAPGDAGFTDVDSISPWAREEVSVFEQTGVVTGMADGSFQPQKAATRAEVAVILQRFVKLFGIM